MAAFINWKQILMEHDVHGGNASEPVFIRGNMLVDNIMHLDGNLFQADILQPEGISSPMAIRDILLFQEEKVLQTVTIRWEDQWGLPNNGDKFFLMNVSDGEFSDHDYHVDGDTLPVPIRHKPTGPLRIFEMYAGGIGGWHGAVQLLRDHHDLLAQVIAIEMDARAVHNYAISHSATVIDGNHRMLPMDIFPQEEMTASFMQIFTPTRGFGQWLIGHQSWFLCQVLAPLGAMQHTKKALRFLPAFLWQNLWRQSNS